LIDQMDKLLILAQKAYILFYEKSGSSRTITSRLKSFHSVRAQD